MKAIRHYMDEAAERGIVKNDSDLAQKLGITRQSVSAWRSGESAPNEDQAAGLAELLGKPEVMAECMAARAKQPAHRAAWEKVARLCAAATTAVVAGAVVTLLLTPSPAEAAPLQQVGQSLFVLCKLW